MNRKRTGGRKLLFVFPLALNLRAHWADRVRAAALAGAEVHVAVPRDETVNALDLGGAILHDIALHRGPLAPFAELRTIFAIRRLIKSVEPDLVHAVTIRPVIYAGILARLLRVPAAVFSVTGLGYLFIGGKGRRLGQALGIRAYRLALNGPNAVTVFENPDDAAFFVERRIVSPGRARVFVGGGIDLDAYAFTGETPSASPLVVLPSRLLADKGVREFVSAARLLRGQGAAARFALVGDVDPGNPATLSRGEIEDWVRDGAVEWWGWRDDMADVIRQSAIVCLPSYREGAPRALIEAAAIGRACVATDVPGCRAVVLDRVTGLLVPPRDAVALAGALRTLIGDPALRARMGAAASAHAERNFSSDLAVDRMLSLYDELLPGWRA
ncbi:MAG: glycosyltransferase family 4 protein [Parvibaculum sp.]|uniref:glycosyltransferase family 4 protein n=1 Tax=Parvibaculum sp. TaxID=2024848 RepID=UPI0025D4351E|nr:glycosyltransferase family 4 protein [Parvibaculum sp.]MCE9649641.1 glycosyltransferase family 4 protein [Parvibaculum sp.]